MDEGNRNQLRSLNEIILNSLHILVSCVNNAVCVCESSGKVSPGVVLAKCFSLESVLRPYYVGEELISLARVGTLCSQACPESQDRGLRTPKPHC